MASKRPKWTEAQIKDHAQKIQKIIEKAKRENKGEHFQGITPEQIRNKFKRVNSPMIVFQSWNDTSPGGTVFFGLGIYNPDPVQAFSLYAHVWVGTGNIDPTVGTFLLNVDPRFPRLTQPEAFGLTIAPGTSTTLNYELVVPPTVELTNYLGNSCLMQLIGFEVGTYLDRTVFAFVVA